MRSILFALLGISGPLLLDYYVYRNWRRFVAYRSKFRWTLPIYRVFLFVMPLTMPVYFLTSNWWEVEPKIVRTLFIGFWAFYYAPKALIALGLLIKDGAHFVSWLFSWFQEQLLDDEAPVSEDNTSTEDASLDLSDIKRESRRKFLQEIGWSAASVPFVIVGYSVFRTLYDFEVHRVDVPITGLPRQFDGLSIAQLSDLHAGSFFSDRPMEEAVSMVHSLKPDVISVTGDFVNHDAAELSVIVPALEKFSADLGVYGCLGNHDHYAEVDDVVAGIKGTAIDLLINERRMLDIDGARLHLIGTDNTGFYQEYADLPGAKEGLSAVGEEDDVRILLAHTPTFWDSHVRPQHADIDLMLCGHTHGGQIGFEMGPLRYSLARVAYQRWAGLYAEPRTEGEGQQFLYVNRGIGTVGPPLRLGIRPEITLLTLRRV